jgi:(+)-pinoresinol hydroxylase
MRRLPLIVVALDVLSHGALLAQESDAATDRGAAVYDAWCAHCHDPVPEGSRLGMLPAVESLTLKYGGALTPYIKERPDLAHFEVLEAFLRNGSGSMQPFRKTEITDEDITALAAYLRSTSSE